jgi:hypothetical protein
MSENTSSLLQQCHIVAAYAAWCGAAADSQTGEKLLMLMLSHIVPMVPLLLCCCATCARVACVHAGSRKQHVAG